MRITVAGAALLGALLGGEPGVFAQAPATAAVDLGGVRLETVTWGTGDPIILLPGYGYSSSAFGLLGPELARRGFRAIAVNPRGVRRSTGSLADLTYHDYAADVREVIDRIAGGRAHVMGWAWGNRIARTLAADSPSRVASIVLLAAGGKVPPDPIVATTTARLREPGCPRRSERRHWRSFCSAPARTRGCCFPSRSPGRTRRPRKRLPARRRPSRNGGRVARRQCS